MENGLYEMRIANLEANMKVLETKVQKLFEASKPVQESMVVSQVNLHTDMLSDFRRDLILLKNGLEWCEEHIKNLEGNTTADSAEAFKEYDRLKAEYNKCQEDLKKTNDQLFNQAQENIGLCMDKNQLNEKLGIVSALNEQLKADYGSACNSIADLKKELEETKEKLKDMIGQRDGLYGAYNGIVSALNDMDSKYLKLSKENQMLKDDNYILKINTDKTNQNDHVENQKTEINRLLKSNEHLKKENDRLRSDNEVCRLNNNNLIAKIDELNKGIANSDDLRVLDKYNALKVDYAKAKNLIDNLEDKLADKDKAINLLGNTISDLGIEKTMLKKERDRLRELYFESIVKEETNND